MIDTIHLTYCFSSKQEQERCLEELVKRYSVDIHSRVTSDNTKYDMWHCQVWDNNFLIKVFNGSIHLQGSLTKLYFGNNIQQLTKNDLINAYNKLLSLFDIVDWRQAVHKRIDLGVNFQLTSSPSLITAKLVGAKRMQKSSVNSNGKSVTIGNDSQSIIFYDKTAESNSKNKKGVQTVDVPSNLIRVECRIMGKYSMEKHFGTSNLTINHILQNTSKLPEIWYIMYSNVEKDYSTINKLFCNKKEMMMTAITEFGLDSMKALIIESFKAGKLTSATRQNMTKYLREVGQFQKLNTHSANSIIELDKLAKSFFTKNEFSNSKV